MSAHNTNQPIQMHIEPNFYKTFKYIQCTSSQIHIVNNPAANLNFCLHLTHSKTERNLWRALTSCASCVNTMVAFDPCMHGFVYWCVQTLYILIVSQQTESLYVSFILFFVLLGRILHLHNDTRYFYEKFPVYGVCVLESERTEAKCVRNVDTNYSNRSWSALRPIKCEYELTNLKSYKLICRKFNFERRFFIRCLSLFFAISCCLPLLLLRIIHICMCLPIPSIFRFTFNRCVTNSNSNAKVEFFIPGILPVLILVKDTILHIHFFLVFAFSFLVFSSLAQINSTSNFIGEMKNFVQFHFIS